MDPVDKVYLNGLGDLVSQVISKVIIRMPPLRGLITLTPKSRESLK